MRRALSLVLVALALGACVGGAKRPTLVPAPSTTTTLPSTNDAAADAFVADIDDGTATFTATYRLVRRLGNESLEATVVQRPGAAVIMVGDQRLFLDAAPTSCTGTTCAAGLDPSPLAIVAVGTDFWQAGAAREVVTTAAAPGPAATTSPRLVAGVPTTCLDVGGDAHQPDQVWCATVDGVIALVDTTALLIQLESYTPTADPAAFTHPA